MPFADDLDQDFDEFNEPAPAPPQVEQESPPWPAAPPRKSKKKKAKKYVGTFKAPEEEDTAFPTSITPSPPDFGLKLDAGLPEPDPPAVARSPQPADDDVEGDIPAREDVEPHFRPSFAASPPVTSPRPAFARPVASATTPPSRPASLAGPPQHYGNQSWYRTNSSVAPSARPHARRESSQSHTSPRPHFVEPVAPPHMPQPHFYGLPDLGFNFGKKKDQDGKAAGSDGYCCCFDSFADSGDVASSKKAKDALLVGSEGGLEVFRVLPNKVEVVGRLEGLRGSVIGAKILPYTDPHDGVQGKRPLVAVIVHGAMYDDQQASEHNVDGKERDMHEPTRYQTTVGVYSLQTQEHVTTLYKSIPVAVEHPTIGHPTSLPAPIGELSISAQGRFVVLASGKSGEIFVFSEASISASFEPQFRCIGKFWTLPQSQLDSPSSRPSSSTEGTYAIDEEDERPGVPLFSLSQRWLALVSPSTSSRVSIQGSPVLSDHHPNPPGLATHVAPPQPPIICDIVGVDAEGTWNRWTRQATQGVVKYSQKGIEMGWQGWKELTNPTPQTGQQHSRASSREHDSFPPTNAPLGDPRRVAQEPAVVSIIDMEMLLEVEETKLKYAPPPLTTFALDEGCNYLSFSSNGLRLLTVSRNGASSTIWDLMQATHGVTNHGSAAEADFAFGPCVKQVHRIPRTSQSVVMGSAWSRDDDYLAVLTTHGTVHLHEVPARPPSRKRKRTSITTVPVPEKAEATVSVSHGMSPPSSNGFLGTLKSGWQQMSTQVSTIRSQNPVPSLSYAGLKEATANASQAGGRVLATTLSQGFSAAKGGASDYWHFEDNKIRHHELRDKGSSRSLRWIRRQSSTLLAVVCAGKVYLHLVERTERRKGDVVVTCLKHDKYGKKHFTLPNIRTSNDQKALQTKKSDDCAAEGPHGFWSLRVSPSAEERRISGTSARTAPSQANEVETNPPYVPFHIDSRVNIFAFDDEAARSQINLLDEPRDSAFHVQGHGMYGEEPWLFGDPLPQSTKMNTHDNLDGLRQRTGFDDSDVDDEEIAEQMESKLTVYAADEPGGEQIRINTRRAPSRRADHDFGVMEDDDSII